MCKEQIFILRIFKFTLHWQSGQAILLSSSAFTYSLLYGCSNCLFNTHTLAKNSVKVKIFSILFYHGFILK